MNFLISPLKKPKEWWGGAFLCSLERTYCCFVNLKYTRSYFVKLAPSCGGCNYPAFAIERNFQASYSALLVENLLLGAELV